MLEKRSSHFNLLFTNRDSLKRKILILPVVIILSVMFFIFNNKTNCVIIKKMDGKVLFIEKTKDNDEIIITHINSIYDAKVEEVLFVENGAFLLKDIKTLSYGVKEYYGITNGFIPKRFNSIIFRNTKDRGFSITINGKKVENMDRAMDSSLTLELIYIPIYEYYCSKLKSLHIW